MEDISRRSAVAFGLTMVAATPLVGLATPAAAAMYGPNEGKEYHPGVRVVMLGKRDSMIPAYKEVPVFIIRNNLKTAGISRDEYFALR